MFIFQSQLKILLNFTKSDRNESLDHPDVAPGGHSNVSVSNALKAVELIALHTNNAKKCTEVI